MTESLRYKKLPLILCFSIFFFTLLTAFLTEKIYAAGFSATDYSLSINITEKKDATFSAQKTLTNNDTLQLITGYEYILPSSKPQNVIVYLNDVEVPSAVYAIDNFNYSKIDINFANNVIKPGETKTLKITATVKNFIKTKDNISFFKVLASKDEGASLKITYPLSLGKPRLITVPKSKLEEIDGNKYQISLSKPDSMLVIWGESYTLDIKSKYTLENATDAKTEALIELPADRFDQEVGTKTVLNSEFGLYDIFGNNFAITEIEPANSNEAGFESKVKKIFNAARIEITEKYEFGFPENNEIVKSILDKTKDEANLYDKLNIANDYLVTTFNSNDKLESNFEFGNKTNYWNSLLEKNTSFASFDYCYVLVAYAEHLGLEAQMNYGYIVLPDDFGSKADPQFWCYFKLENKIFLMDPYSLSSRGFDFFGSETEFDRITVGIWTPTQIYNKALGLLDQNNFVKQIEFAEINEFEIPGKKVAITNSDGPRANAGFYHTLGITVENETYKFIKLLEVRLDDNLFSQAIDFNNKLKLALLPNQSNELTLKKVRNYNFLDNGIKSTKIEITLDNNESSSISSNVSIHYVTTKSVLVVMSAIVSLMFIISLATLIWYKFKHRG